MQTITTFDNTAGGWERSLYAFLAEKERRSGSRRTVEGYSRMLQHFFGTTGKPPDRITSAEVFAWGYGVGLSGKEPSSVTIGARLACLSSFYRFLIRMDIVSSNPCDAGGRHVGVAVQTSAGADGWPGSEARPGSRTRGHCLPRPAGRGLHPVPPAGGSAGLIPRARR